MSGKNVTLKSFSCYSTEGQTIWAEGLGVTVEAEIIQSWEDREIGQRYIGTVSDPSMIEMLKKLGAQGDKVSFGPTNITNRGGLSSTQLHTLRLIRKMANDLDPERPKFKSTLDSIEAQIQELKKDLKIDKIVQDSSAPFDENKTCDEEFYRKDLHVLSNCGRKKNHKGEHSWYSENVANPA